MFIFERERERESGRQSTSGGGAEREGGRHNLKQAPGSEPSAQSPTWGSNSQTARSCPEPKSDAQPTQQPRCSYFLFFNVYLFLRERMRAEAREGQREEERESQAGSTLSAQSPVRMWGSNPPTMRS